MKKASTPLVLIAWALMLIISSCQSNKKTATVGQTGNTVAAPAIPGAALLDEYLNALYIKRSEFTPLSNGKVLVLSYYFNANNNLTLKGQQVNGGSGNFIPPLLNFTTLAKSQVKFTGGPMLSNVLVPKEVVRAIQNLPSQIDSIYFMPEIYNSEIRYAIRTNGGYPLADSSFVNGLPPTEMYANPSPPKNYNTGN